MLMTSAAPDESPYSCMLQLIQILLRLKQNIKFTTQKAQKIVEVQQKLVFD